jgi:macrolide transport system ATP-binding/permease protein
MGSPSLLLCDEPTGNLDSKNSESILDFFTDSTGGNDDRRRHARRKRGASRLAPGQHEGWRTRRRRRAGKIISIQGAHCPSGITARDLVIEAIAGAIARPARMALTVLGIVIGMSALVATVGLTRTAGNRIISQFDQLAATELFISDARVRRRARLIRAPFHGTRRNANPIERRGGRGPVERR